MVEGWGEGEGEGVGAGAGYGDCLRRGEGGECVEDGAPRQKLEQHTGQAAHLG